MLPRLLFIFVLSVFLTPCTVAQSNVTASASDPIHLVEIVAPRTVDVGAVAHFRARQSAPSSGPVSYLWDLGDGTLSVGPLVSYMYSTPGKYTIQVVGRNEAGTDTLRVSLQVRRAEPVLKVESSRDNAPAPPRPSTIPSAPNGEPPVQATVPRSTLFGSGGVSPSNGGYTWVVGSDLWAERAQDQMLAYRLRGLKADVHVEREGPGSPVHRIVVGQFATEEQALVGQAWMPSDLDPKWLVPLARR